MISCFMKREVLTLSSHTITGNGTLNTFLHQHYTRKEGGEALSNTFLNVPFKSASPAMTKLQILLITIADKEFFQIKPKDKSIYC